MNQNQDELHLKLLSIFHYVLGAFTALIACFPLLHFVVGVGLIIASLTDKSVEAFPGLLFGLFFAGIAGSFIVFGWMLAICMVLAGRYISRREKYIFCLIMAGVGCTLAPFGTVLGVFTILVLVRPSVKELFDTKALAKVPNAA
jgi:hypothetical protein